ncbi:aldo/keto reductase [Nonomuraea aridisoli]|uniref:D-threo-aldose 1-dehydrogenase n=1 Tax=Nonomuraea aridisoli TaxID=2070368 RepID=A0A2W2DFG8_9ACTN|nr:aldo/keto reductase [Nonomuraea aridisoli]PZG02659.1 D-threo-aldose 1-dehydrogenase [Nonomuraea aridisoli]
MSIGALLPADHGLGTAPLGDIYRAIPEDEARATVETAWDQGVRYFDTAPFYGAGLAEIRLGEVLSTRPRDAYVLSTKIGRVILDEREDPASRRLGDKEGLFAHGRPNTMVEDYSADATRRSIEDSLERLRTDRLDIVWVHDIAEDFWDGEWLAAFESARTGAFRVLQELRDEGVIQARVGRLRAVAARHGVGVKAAALQFSLAHPATVAVIPGASRPGRIAEDLAALREKVPAVFWADLREEGLIAPDAPVPRA